MVPASNVAAIDSQIFTHGTRHECGVKNDRLFLGSTTLWLSMADNQGGSKIFISVKRGTFTPNLLSTLMALKICWKRKKGYTDYRGLVSPPKCLPWEETHDPGCRVDLDYSYTYEIGDGDDSPHDVVILFNCLERDLKCFYNLFL